MPKIKSQKGITLLVLVLTIIILIILASITIYSGKESIKESKANALIAEVNMVQHAALEKHITEQTFQTENYPGTKKYATSQEILAEIEEIADDTTLNDIITHTSAEDYYYLTPEDLTKLNITNTENSYIVNYKLGIAINVTMQTTGYGEPVYVYAKTRDE